ncbi:MAG: hypothetical protein K9L85_01520 [Candidatus Peribacteraceae bacterium]|nr:hypothetical protein [Candidatus Peribacteraceae bacterium]
MNNERNENADAAGVNNHPWKIVRLIAKSVDSRSRYLDTVPGFGKSPREVYEFSTSELAAEFAQKIRDKIGGLFEADSFSVWVGSGRWTIGVKLSPTNFADAKENGVL